MENYTIQSGDNLWNIVKKHYNNSLSNSELEQKVQELSEFNGISNPSLINAGQKIDLSCFEQQFPDSYTVESGDSLWKITQNLYKENLSVEETEEIIEKIAQYNNIEDPSKIFKGQEIDLTCLSNIRNIEFDFNEKMSKEQQSALKLFEENFNNNKDKYQKVEQETGVPAELVAAIHWRESSGNFNTYLHNGQKLGQITTIVPKGIYFENWTDAAIDAINSHNPEIVDENEIETWYEFAEKYNGLGYRNRGVASPYVWAGTDNYTSGKYIADGKYDPNHVDQQLGVALMLKTLLS